MKHTKHNNLVKRILAMLLIAMLLLTGAPPLMQPAYAAEQSKAGQTTGDTTFVTHNQPEDAFKLSLRDGALYVDSFPTAGGYKCAFVKFKNENTIRCYTAEPKPLPLPEKDGTYYLQISLGEEFATPGHPVEFSIALDRLAVTVKDGKAFFPKSPVYDNNLKFQKKEAKINAPDWYYTMQTFSTYFETEADKKAFEKKLKKQAEAIVDAGDSDLVKTRKVHDWVAANIYYDYDDFYGIKPGPRGSEKDVLEQRHTVCEGYATLTAALLRSLGIPAKVTHGYVIGGLGTGKEWTNDPVTSGGGGHAWTEAYVDGRWLIMDTTWDSTNSYKNGQFKKGNWVKHAYFDPSLELFSMDHKTEGDGQLSRRESEIYYDGLTINAYSLTLTKGKTKKLTVKADKKYINLKKDAKITFSSSNKKVATVSKNGVVKAKKEGNATITTKVKIADAVIEIETSVWVPF